MSSDEKKDCWQNRTYRKVLGQGSYGQVVAVCSDASLINCKTVVKVQNIESVWQRENAYLQYLSSSGLTPKFVTAWTCDKKFYTEMEFFDLDMEDLASSQAQLFGQTFDTKIPQYFLTPKQLARLVKIAMELFDTYKIIHFDLKLSNFLYRSSDQKIVCADFGLAGGLKAFPQGQDG